MYRPHDSREDRVVEGRRTDESERLMAAAEEADGAPSAHRGTSPPAGAANQATVPPGNGDLDGSALAHGLDRLEQAGAGH